MPSPTAPDPLAALVAAGTAYEAALTAVREFAASHSQADDEFYPVAPSRELLEQWQRLEDDIPRTKRAVLDAESLARPALAALLAEVEGLRSRVGERVRHDVEPDHAPEECAGECALHRLAEARSLIVSLEAAHDRSLVEVEQIKGDVRLVLEAFEAGVFVRDVRGDSDPAWAMKLMRPVAALARLADAVPLVRPGPA